MNQLTLTCQIGLRKHGSSAWCTKYFDTLNRLGVDHTCDTDRRTDGR